MHGSSYNLMEEFVRGYLNRANILNIYDIGSRAVSGKNGTYYNLFDENKWVYKGVDIKAGDNVDIVVKPYEWDIEDGVADVVVSGQCIEHVEKVWLWFEQVCRIVKPGGLICVIGPTSGREHRHPVDCWRVLPDGMQLLCKMNGMKVLKCETPAKADPKWRDCITIATKPKE